MKLKWICHSICLNNRHVITQIDKHPITMKAEVREGTIFNIQPYSIHDGPGIRTTVFLKGCPLKCIWCQNPESQSKASVLFYTRDKCTGCGACVAVCENAAIQIINEKSVTDRSVCDGCGTCVAACGNEAREIVGQSVTASEVFEEVNKDAVFYENSGGGVTISGGDPVAQPEFTMALSKQCSAAGIHVTVETCGHANWEKLQLLLTYADLVLFDIKHIDGKAHRACTGVDNRAILDNIKRVYHELGLPLRARVPVVPGYNATDEDIRQIAEFIVRELGQDVPVHLLPYHKLGVSKHHRLEVSPNIVDIEPPTEARMRRLRDIVASYGLESQIGG